MIIALFVCGVLVLLSSNILSRRPKTTTEYDKINDYNDLYNSCSGNPFVSTCLNEECIDSGIEKRVFDLWKKEFIQTHNLSESYFDEHIIIGDVSYRIATSGDGETHWWRVNYIYNNDWVSSRHSDSVDLVSPTDPTEFSTVSELDDERIIYLIDASIDKNESFDSPIISYSKAVNIMKKSGLDYDFCSIRFVNVPGELTLFGSKQESFTSDMCTYSRINLHSGKLEEHSDPCSIDSGGMF